MKITQGSEIPGPILAIKAMKEGLKVSLEQGLEIEKNNFVEAVLSKQAKGSIHTFFLKTMSDKAPVAHDKRISTNTDRQVNSARFWYEGKGNCHRCASMYSDESGRKRCSWGTGAGKRIC